MRTLPLMCAAVVAATPVLLAPTAHATPLADRGTAQVHASAPAAPSAAAGPVTSSPSSPSPSSTVSYAVALPASAPAASSPAAESASVVAAEEELAATGMGPVGWIIGVAVAVLVVGVLLVRRMSRD